MDRPALQGRWLIALVVAVLSAFGTLSQAANAAKKPDLRVTALTDPPAAVQHGGSFEVTDTTKNAGKRTAAGTITQCFLTPTGAGPEDLVEVGERDVKRLKPRKKQSGTCVAAIEAGVEPGGYRVVACADGNETVNERKESNNCRTSDGSVEVQCPPALDVPDPSFADTDCDGIDGAIANAVFVSKQGSDGPGCGSRELSCATIGTGFTQAVAAGKEHVYVAGGDYPETAVVANGVSIYGGFGQNFERDPGEATGATTVRITGGGATTFPSEVPQWISLVAYNLNEPSVISDLEVVGQDVTERLGSGQGKSSYGIVVRDVFAGVLTIERVTVTGGDGADGADGTAGNSATGTAAPSGVDGGPSVEMSTSCNNTSHGEGGGGGVNGGVTGAAGGAGGDGGDGGEMDTDCAFFSPNLDATPGDIGTNAEVFQASGPGFRGPGGPTCSAGGDGNAGRIQNGSAGMGAIGASGRLTGHYWYGKDGGAGGAGTPGGGGGGGGGSGGCDEGTDSWGAGGGGGGAGGAAAAAGSDGKGGGGSFGIYLINAAPAIEDVSVIRGDGGDGGDGGAGGQGQPGGQGGTGGVGIGTGKGGDGGDGAHGGHGGGGGGGAGGIVAGVFISSSGSVPAITNLTVSAGSPGSGGAGGISAPGATGTPLDDGNDGGAGVLGSSYVTHTCATLSAC